jgi:hypothetical protein
VDNGNGTISDSATALMWMKNDNGTGIPWKDALSYADSSQYAGYSDWRLPNPKELQSIVDYTRSPSTTGSAAIDPIFNCTSITNENGQADYPYYWTATTLAPAGPPPPGLPGEGVYVAFGRALGYMSGVWQDVHGAGAQRSDPKTGDPSRYPQGRGPQGDAVRIHNYVRLVRGGFITTGIREEESSSTVLPEKFMLHQNYPNPFNPTTTISFELPIESFVSLKVYDILGKEVATLVSDKLGAGHHEVTFNASELTSGVYLYNIQVGSYTQTKKLLLLR